MKRFDLNPDFSADCIIADKSRSGEVYHVRRNASDSGKTLTPVARYFAWQPDFIEGFNPHWRVDCFVTRHPLVLCEPIWLSSHRSDDEKGQAYGNVFEDE